MTDFTELIDLASQALGGTVIATNDEFFAPKEALLKPAPAEWREGAYTERGKWMDGWETRRRRTPGHDWAIVHLGVRGVVRGVVIDTSFFRGNYPERASIEGCDVAGTPSPVQLEHPNVAWHVLLDESPLSGDALNNFVVGGGLPVTHLRLNIFPDGGVARLRVHGDVVPSFEGRTGLVDLAAVENGGYSVVCSDMFFGHRQNLIMPGRSTFMGDGWETKRRRGPGHDWTIIRLGHAGIIEQIEIDTDHFKGNAPNACMIECVHAAGASVESLTDAQRTWTQILPSVKLQPHARHAFTATVSPHAPHATHARLNIYPDGGIARLRLYGRLLPT